MDTTSGRAHDGDPLQRARSIGSKSEARSLYAEWAAGYDADVFGMMQVTGSRRIAELFGEHVADRSIRVVDLGCGTGAVGVRLAELGFTDVVGVDLSPEMLAIAAATGAYRSIFAADLDQPPVTGAPFGGSVCSGTFVGGHVGAGAVPALLAMLQPRSVFAWSVAPAMWPGIHDVLDDEGVEIVRSDLEPIRQTRTDLSHMIVARTRRT